MLISIVHAKHIILNLHGNLRKKL
uniref:Uncharacterized protein n=1 Tax=Anguilla anguilla TaxID=7936 RepID=A0A0E9V3X6_ANGAN